VSVFVMVPDPVLTASALVATSLLGGGVLIQHVRAWWHDRRARA